MSSCWLTEVEDLILLTAVLSQLLVSELLSMNYCMKCAFLGGMYLLGSTTDFFRRTHRGRHRSANFQRHGASTR